MNSTWTRGKTGIVTGDVAIHTEENWADSEREECDCDQR